MDKSQNKLYKTGKKWVITAFAATTIVASGYSLFNSNVAYADDGQTVTTNGNYVEMASNASKEAQSSSDIVSSISDKWQYCPGGDSLRELREQVINDAYSASSASFKLSQSQMDENEQSLAASTAISYADNAISIASVATVSASSISNVASSLASSAQYKIGIYKSYAASVNAKIHDLSDKVKELDKDGDIKNSPRLSSVDVLSHLTDDVSNADIMLSDVNSMADSTTTNVISNSHINSLYYAMLSLSMGCFNISMLSSSLSYSDVLYNASVSIQSKKDDDKFRQINNSLNFNANKNSNENILSSAFAFSSALSAYDIARNLYSKMHGDNIYIYSSIDETPYRVDSYVLTNEFPKVEDAFYNISSNLKEAVDQNNQFYPSIDSAFDAAKNTASMAAYVSNVFASQFPLDSIIDMENSNISMANSAYSAIDSLSRAVASHSEENNSDNNSVYKGIDSYIDIISSAADQTKNYSDNVSSLNTKWGKNSSSLTSLSNQTNDYANLVRNESDKSKKLGHSQTLKQSSLSASYASSLVSKASENNSAANSIANSLSAATSTNSDNHKNSNTSSNHLNNSSVTNLQNNSVYNPNNNFIYKIPTNSSNSGTTNHSSQTSSTNSSAEYYVPSSTASSATSQSASSAFASSSATTSSSATSSSSNPITASTNSDSPVYKKLYQKVQKNLTKEIAINKSKAAKFKKAYQKTKNKRDKAKQLKAYQDAQYKLKLAQKHYRSINK